MPITIDLTALRQAIRGKHWVEIDYTNQSGETSQRQIRPLCLVFIAPVWLLAAWCETRQDFREFRVDRIGSMKINGETFRDEQGKTLEDLVRQRERR